jgi:hypothetical protein
MHGESGRRWFVHENAGTIVAVASNDEATATKYIPNIVRLGDVMLNDDNEMRKLMLMAAAMSDTDNLTPFIDYRWKSSRESITARLS